MDKEEILKKVESVSFWYHSIPLGQGVVTPGITSLELEEEKGKGIPEDLSGMSVLDIGAWDGYFSFLAEQRGAKRVLAIDSFPFREGARQGGRKLFKDQSRRGFDVAKEILRSKVEFREMDLYDLDRLDENFDVVFFFELHHHIWDPILGITLACGKCNRTFCIEGSMLNIPAPIMVLEDQKGDLTKQWRLSEGLIQNLVTVNGFSSMAEVYSKYESVFYLRELSPAADSELTCATRRVFLRCWK